MLRESMINEHVRLEIHKYYGIYSRFKRLPRPKYIDVDKEVKISIELYDPERMMAIFKEIIQNAAIRVNWPDYLITFNRKHIRQQYIQVKNYSQMEALIEFIRMKIKEFGLPIRKIADLPKSLNLKRLIGAFLGGFVIMEILLKRTVGIILQPLSAASASVSFLKSVWR